jgi:putative SOS response-associated peptidase YedK
MCGRIYLGDRTSHEVEEDMDLESGAISMASGDVTPAMTSTVLVNGRDKAYPTSESGIGVTTMFWGLVGQDKKLIINARAESVLDKPMFSDSFLHRRLVVPAAGFYEWDRDKNKVTFFRSDRSPIYLAGFYQLSDNKDSFVILTTAANDSMIRVHDRMPLMIDRHDVAVWLRDREAAQNMLGMEMPLLESRRDYEQLSLF